MGAGNRGHEVPNYKKDVCIVYINFNCKLSIAIHHFSCVHLRVHLFRATQYTHCPTSGIVA